MGVNRYRQYPTRPGAGHRPDDGVPGPPAPQGSPKAIADESTAAAIGGAAIMGEWSTLIPKAYEILDQSNKNLDAAIGLAREMQKARDTEMATFKSRVLTIPIDYAPSGGPLTLELSRALKEPAR